MSITRKRPEESFATVMGAGPTQVGPKDKRFTAIKMAAPGTAQLEAGELGGGIFRPTDEQLDKINHFTRSSKTADEVAVIPTMSANTIRDRDLDKFTPECIGGFAKLPQPFSPIGKSFMMSHDTTKLPIGRIFDTGTQDVDGELFLTNDVYVPNTDQYKDYLENVDFGLNWAVSVGVMIGKQTCTIGEPHAYSGRWWCSEGHEKGLAYDPKSSETDDWGWPLPVDPQSKGAVICGVDFDDPTDFYELSQVYLGAQFYAELAEKDPSLLAVVKGASFPVIGLSTKEADEVPLTHLPDKVRQSRASKSKVVESKDGDYRWIGDDGLLYTFDPSESMDTILCIGRPPKETEAEKKAKELKSKLESLREKNTVLYMKAVAKASDDDDDDSPVTLAEAVDAALDSVETELNQVSDQEDAHLQQAMDLLDGAESSIDELVEALGGDDPDDPDDDDDDKKGATPPMSKKAITAVAKAAGLPAPLLEALEAADESKALEVVIGESAKQIKQLTEKAEHDAPLVKLGDEYISTLRVDVKEAYVRAKQLGERKGVDTTHVERLITLAAEDTELLKSMLDEYEAEAKAKTPGEGTAVIRSTFPADANKHTSGSDGPSGRPDNSFEKDRTREDAVDAQTAEGRKSLAERLHQ